MKNSPSGLYDCESCEAINLEKQTLPKCETCKKPELSPQNYLTWNVYTLCRSQLIVGFSGVIGLRLEGIIAAMDLLEITDPELRLSIVDKLLAGVDVLYQRNEIQEQPETFGSVEDAE